MCSSSHLVDVMNVFTHICSSWMSSLYQVYKPWFCPNIIHSCLLGVFLACLISTLSMKKFRLSTWWNVTFLHLVWHAQRLMISSKSTLCTHFTPPLKLVHIVTIILLSSTCYKVVDQIAMVASNVVHCNLRGPHEEYQMYLYHTKTA